MMDALIVYITAPKEDEAVKIGRALVEAHIAGCVNIVRAIRSIYSWQGKIEDDEEVLMIVKTRADLFGALQTKVKELHSYKVPEIIALPVAAGSEDYINWLNEVTRQEQ